MLNDDMTYLDAAYGIFDWLSRLQVKQGEIIADRTDYGVHLSLTHPVEGEITVATPIDVSKVFRCHGIGLNVTSEKEKEVILSVYDNGGIFDPIDANIPGEHYAASHYALLGAVLYREYEEKHILDCIKRAFGFHIRTCSDGYSLDNWGYHWDFKNYALLETYLLMNLDLSEEERLSWVRALKSWKQNKDNYLCNWTAMRAYASLLRSKTWHRWGDRWLYHRWTKAMLRSRQSNGCFDDDFRRSRPIQYHAFTLAMIHRILGVKFDEVLARYFLSGVSYLVKFIDPDGCYKTVGRGQEQIFGYGTALYVLEAARRLDRANADLYGVYAHSIWKHLLTYRKEDDHFPLVLNRRLDEERFGWYDYHHLTVYNAFLGAWLGLTHRLCADQPISGTLSSRSQPTGMTYLKDTQQIVYSNAHYYICLSAGLPDYLSEPGISPAHVWFRDIGWVYSCPGGASPRRFGKVHRIENIEKNLFAPIAYGSKDWYIPAGRPGVIFKCEDDSATLAFDYGIFEVTRTVRFEKEKIEFSDDLRFMRQVTLDELRLINFPVVIDKFKIDLDRRNEVRLLHRNGVIRLLLEVCEPKVEIFELGESIKTAKGMAQIVTLRIPEFAAIKGRNTRVRFSLQAIV